MITCVSFVGCSGASGDSMPSSTSTTTAVSPGPRKSASAELKALAKAVNAIDYSGISRSSCGGYAFVVTADTVNFLYWDGRQWSDKSQLLEVGRGEKPYRVFTRDFTNDGILDFFVMYQDNVAKGDGYYGSYFGFPWDPEQKCAWEWMDIDNGRDIVTTVQNASVPRNERQNTVSGNGFRGRYGTFGEYHYDPSKNVFVFQEVLKQK